MLYYTSKSRSKKVVVEILGDNYEGVTVQDFYPSYDQGSGFEAEMLVTFNQGCKGFSGEEKITTWC